MPPRVRAALSVDTVELRAAGQAPAPSSGHRLRRQTLALLVAAALEDEATGLRLHALAEPVRAGSLALLRLVRALHAMPESSPRSIVRISALIAWTSVEWRERAADRLYARPSSECRTAGRPQKGPIDLA